MKTNLTLIFITILLCFSTISCRQADTCEDDKKDGKWGEIVDNDSCSADEKGEAYLALGGFNFFNFRTQQDEDIVSTMGITDHNWETKLNYFESSANAVRSSYQDGSDTEKTIFLLASTASCQGHTRPSEPPVAPWPGEAL